MIDIDTRVPFVGRAAELQQVAELAATPGPITLCGPGGSGKSRLALEFAEHLRASGAPVTFVSLVAAGADGVADAVATALGARERGTTPALESALARLSSYRGYLILDNCEHVLDDVRDLCTALEALPNVVVLLTSRRRLGIRGERVVDVGQFTPEDATAFFAACVRARGHHFDPSPDQRTRVHQIVERLDRLAIAIDLAATRYPAKSLDHLAKAVADPQPAQLRSSHAHDERHWALDRTFQWSFSLLSPQAQHLLAYCASFNAPFDADDARAMVDPALSTENVEGLLRELVDHSLLVCLGSAYAMLVPVRSAARKLTTVHDRRIAAERLAERMGELARRYAYEIAHDGMVSAAREVERRYADLRNVLEWSLRERSRLPLTETLCSLLVTYWADGGHVSEGMLWTQRVLDAAERLSPRDMQLQARLWSQRLTVCYAAGAYQILLDHAPMLIGAFTQVRDMPALAHAYNALSVASFHLGWMREARSYAETALPFARSGGDQRRVAAALCNIGNVAFDGDGDPRAALTYYRQACDISRSTGSLRFYALVLRNAAEAHRVLGEYETAERLLNEAVEIMTDLSNPSFHCLLYQTYADLRLSAGDVAGSRAAVERASGFVTADAMPEAIAGFAEAAAQLALAENHPCTALRLFSTISRYRHFLKLSETGHYRNEVRASAERARQLCRSAIPPSDEDGTAVDPGDLLREARTALEAGG